MIEENAKLSPNSYDVVETTCCHRTRLAQLSLQVTKIKNSDLLSPVRYIPSNGRDTDLWIELQVWLWLLRGQSSWHIKSSVKDEWIVTDRVIINPVMRILKKEQLPVVLEGYTTFFIYLLTFPAKRSHESYWTFTTKPFLSVSYLTNAIVETRVGDTRILRKKKMRWR